jgi:hypothetical protein
MNPRPDPQWDAAVDRELKNLPELPAPGTLAPRVMAAIRRRGAIRWYSQPWPMWPAALRAVSLAVMLAFFGGLCFASWKFSEAGSVMAATRSFAGWMSGWDTILNTLNTLAGALRLAVGRIDAAILIAVLAAAAISYAACVGLGTVFTRFAFVRSRN